MTPRSEAEIVNGRRLWATFMISLRVEVAEAILAGLPVMAANLDGEALRRSLRGARLPDPGQFLVVTDAMLDALDEAGPLSDDEPSLTRPPARASRRRP